MNVEIPPQVYLETAKSSAFACYGPADGGPKYTMYRIKSCFEFMLGCSSTLSSYNVHIKFKMEESDEIQILCGILNLMW